MRSFVVALISLSVCFAGCHSADSSRAADTSRLVPEPDIAERLIYQKNSIDSFASHHRGGLFVYGKLSNVDSLVRIADTAQPDSLLTTYSVLKDTTGRIVFISEHPHSESGDWFVLLNHYFDQEGRTFAFERNINQFSPGCGGGMSFETTTKFYDAGFHMIDSTYKLVDNNNQALKRDSCPDLMGYEYMVAPTLVRLLDSTRIGQATVRMTL